MLSLTVSSVRRVVIGMTIATACSVAFAKEPAAGSSAARREAMIARIDELLDARRAEMKVEVAPPASDSEFLRRISLDLHGAVPRVAEVREFLADTSDNKRALWVDRMIASPSFSQHMAEVWRNIMLPSTSEIEQIQSVAGVHNWLRRQFDKNARYDQMVSDLLVATSGREAGPALYYTSLELKPEKLASSTARIFLGIHLECAQCHNHPFDHWKQEDFWGYAAFFAQLRGAGQSVPGMAADVADSDTGEVKLPDTEKVIAPKYPGGTDAAQRRSGSRRLQLAIWMASRDNPYLPRAGVNRLWWVMFGRGLVEPVDDMNEKNVPTHPELLNELSRYFVETGFDVREVLRTIAGTKAYQRSSVAAADLPPESYAAMPVRALSAEQIYDSLARALDRQPMATFPGLTNDSAFDQRRIAFLAKMRAPSKNALDYAAGVPQALTLLNGDDTAEAADGERSGLLGALESPLFTDEKRIETMFLAVLTRTPDAEERQVFGELLSKASPGEKSKALGDALWVLLNSAEFATNH